MWEEGERRSVGVGSFTLLIHFCLCVSGVLQQSQLAGSGVDREDSCRTLNPAESPQRL